MSAIRLPADALTEQLLVSAIVANPTLLADEQVQAFEGADLLTPLAIEVFAAVRGEEHRAVFAGGEVAEAVTRAAVVSRIEAMRAIRHEVPEGHWITRNHDDLDELLALADGAPPSLAAVHRMIARVKADAAERRRIAEATFRAADETEQLEAELDEFALRDVDPQQTLPVESVPINGKHVAPPKARWILPLESFLGDEEPSDDDAEDWLIRDVVPRGEAALLAGPPKCGKTWMMLSLGLTVAMGQTWLDKFENTLGAPARVLLLAFEDGQRRLRKRVWQLARAQGISPNDPVLREHLSISREPLALPGDERAFAAELARYKPAAVLIDNLTRVMVGDQNAIKDAKRFSDVWCRIGSDVGATVMFLHHTSKIGPVRLAQRNEGDPFELIRGSGDLVASARHIVLTRPLDGDLGDGAKLSDVRMRGNMDLRREDFVLGFQREQRADRWLALLSDRGAGEVVRDELAEKRREKATATKAAKRSDSESSVDERVFRAIVRMNAEGARALCTITQLQETSGCRGNGVKPAVERLHHANRIRPGEVIRIENGRKMRRTIWEPVPPGSGAS